MTRTLWLLASLLFCSHEVIAQLDTRPTEGLRENTPRVHVLKGATVIPAPGREIENGTIVLRDGLIKAVGGPGLPVPADARVWGLSGMTIYAGFIEPWAEIEAADAEGDIARHWNSKVRPERLASENLKSFPEDSAAALRELGFTMAQLVPKEGIFRGTSCLVSLCDRTPGQRIVSKRVAQCIAFEHGGGGYPASLMGSIALTRQTLSDAIWHRDASAEYREDPKGGERIEANDSLAALRSVADGNRMLLFRSRDELSFARFLRVAAEFGAKPGLLGNGHEYRVLDTIRAARPPLVVPIAFPEAPPVEDADAALGLSLAELEHWELAPYNPVILEAAEIPFSLTATRIAKPKRDFWKNLRLSVELGLSEEAALAALTTEPAKLVGALGKAGTIAKGKLANLVVADGNLFRDGDVKIHGLWIDGRRFELEPAKKVDLSGRWKVWINGGDEAQSWEISGTEASLKLNIGEESFPGKIADGRRLLAFPKAELLGSELKGLARLSAEIASRKALFGSGIFPDGSRFSWRAEWLGESEAEEKEEAGDKAKAERESGVLVFGRYPAGAFGVAELPEQPEAVLVRGATIWTSARAGKLEGADLLVSRGKIAGVGKRLKAPDGAVVIDGEGLHVTPGMIDCHSHIAISRGVNESSHAVTLEVRVGDVVDPTDIALYRQLAGGLTTTNLLHGSANPMGGQNQVIKLRWGSRDAEAMKFKGAKPGVKFALGENVKQSNWERRTSRYPQTRMGVEQIMRDTFLAARDYERLQPERRNLRLEAALEVLKGERIVHIHSYRQDEILMFVRLAEELGFTVGTFQHVLEGYKVADAIAKLGAGGSTFSDWWAYKMEVYDAIPHNGALMQDVGVTMSFNSDDAELGTRMNLEAAKAIKYGGLSEEEALKFVTINPAEQLGIDNRVGSLEEGKDADFVIWNAHPMSAAAVAQQTWIDGRPYYTIDRDAEEGLRIASERDRLIAKALPQRMKSLGKDEGDDGAAMEGDPKRRSWLGRSLRAECRTVFAELYHDGRSLHTCSRFGCCGR